jgi:hypothetical protein
MLFRHAMNTTTGFSTLMPTQPDGTHHCTRPSHRSICLAGFHCALSPDAGSCRSFRVKILTPSTSVIKW